MGRDTNQQTNAATKTKTIERISRLRSSSRCSRKDICPPSSSSPDSFPSSNFFGKRGITVEWPRPEEFFSPLPLGEGKKTLRSEEHTSELQSQFHLVCRLLLEKKKSIRAK